MRSVVSILQFIHMGLITAWQKGLGRLKNFRKRSFAWFIHLKFQSKIGCLGLVLLFGCSRNDQQNLSVYRMLAASLNSSNATLANTNRELMNSIEYNYNGSVSPGKLGYWIPKCRVIQSRSTAMVSYIDSLKYKLKSLAGLQMVNEKEVFAEADFKAVSVLFGSEGMGNQLKERLSGYEMELLSVDSSMKTLIQNLFVSTLPLSDPSQNPAKTFEETFFQHTPVVGVIAILNNFQNNVRVIENQLLQYCRDKMSS